MSNRLYKVTQLSIAAKEWQSFRLWAALISTLLLATSWGFPQLSVAAMLGLPALSLAMLSIYWLLLYQESLAWPWLVASGIMMGFSLQTKLFTAFLVPILLVYLGGIWLSTEKKSWKTFFWTVLSWLLAVSLVYLTIGLISGQLAEFFRIISFHLKQPDPTDKLLAANFNSFAFLRSMLSQDRRYLLPFVLAAAVLIVRKRLWRGALPILWLLASIIVILKHKPIWYHHYLLFSIPFYWLVGIAIAFLISFLHRQLTINWKVSKPIQRAIYLGTVSLFLFSFAKTIPPLPIAKPYGDPVALERVISYKPKTKWLFTDRPVYAFRAGLNVPPEAAVISAKRFNSGDMTLAKLLLIWQKYEPEQILLSRWTDKIQQDVALSSYLTKNYEKTYDNTNAKIQHYVRYEIAHNKNSAQ